MSLPLPLLCRVYIRTSLILGFGQWNLSGRFSVLVLNRGLRNTAYFDSSPGESVFCHGNVMYSTVDAPPGWVTVGKDRRSSFGSTCSWEQSYRATELQLNLTCHGTRVTNLYYCMPLRGRGCLLCSITSAKLTDTATELGFQTNQLALKYVSSHLSHLVFINTIMCCFDCTSFNSSVRNATLRQIPGPSTRCVLLFKQMSWNLLSLNTVKCTITMSVVFSVFKKSQWKSKDLWQRNNVRLVIVNKAAGITWWSVG